MKSIKEPGNKKFEYEFKVESIEPHRDEINREYHPYTPSAELAQAVNLAIALERPLLVEGDPGCGKTQLAYALARQLFIHNQEAINSHNRKAADKDKIKDWAFYIWNVKSSSDAQEDGLYRFDEIGRLRDAQYT